MGRVVAGVRGGNNHAILCAAVVPPVPVLEERNPELCRENVGDVLEMS